jgi:UDP-N-acetylglucosamine:LPS N-acetylglucosamine transferase
VGDLASAVEVVRMVPGVVVLCLCGRNEGLRRRLEAAFGADRRIRVFGFVDDMTTVLAATDVLIHSTAGLTVLEAHMLGCRVISYGFGRGHIRLNDRAFERLGFATVVASPGRLTTAVEDALAAPRASRVAAFAALPAAATLILELAAMAVAVQRHSPGTAV